ncbi:MAG: ABC transporter substrate-binding protein [Oscillibacter sp.]|nr:ABC transporter substrate-binding protein [Oscillibacter sp.]
MRKLRKLAVLCLALLLLSGCWQEEPETPELLPPVQEEEEEPPVLLPERFALPYSPGQSLNPSTCADGMQQVAASLLYEGLFRLDAAFTPQPQLCVSYTYDPESFRYVFTLRSGILFSDGSLLTGRDVRTSLDLARTSPRYQSRLSEIVSISAKDDTVTVVLSGPNSGFPSLLDVPILKSGTQDAAAPVGTGPYFFSEEETGAYLIANQSWWKNEEQPVDRISLVDASDHDAMLYRFSSHEVQLIAADLTGISPVSTTGSVACLDAAATLLQYIGCNTARAPLDNPALRRALSAGINRSYVAVAFLSGHGTASHFPVSPASPLYPKELEEKMPAFSEALVNTGELQRPLTLLVNQENSFKLAIANYLAETWTAGGLSVEVQALPWEEYTAALAAGNFDLYYGEARLTADWNLSSLLAPAGTLNYGHWSHPETSRLLTAYASAEDRTAAMKALCAHLQDQVPILPVCFKSVSVLTQANVVEGLQPTAAEPFYNLGQCVIHLKEA